MLTLSLLIILDKGDFLTDLYFPEQKSRFMQNLNQIWNRFYVGNELKILGKCYNACQLSKFWKEIILSLNKTENANQFQDGK